MNNENLASPFVKRLLAAAMAALATIELASVIAPMRAFAEEPYVIDTYGLYGSSDYSKLETQATATSEKYGVGVYLLTVNDIGAQSARAYAIDFYRNHSLGFGDGKSGILFLVAVDSRDYVTITYGDGINAFTDWQISNIEDAVVDELHDNDWLDAAQTYLDKADYTLAFRAEHGEPLDSHNAPTEPVELLIFIVIAVVIAAAAAGGRCFFLYRKMKTAVAASDADDYVDRDSFTLQKQNDWYVTSTVVATPKAQSSSNGGSSVSSGGFGGSSGGKF